MPTPEVITTLSPAVASGSWSLPGKSTGSLTQPPSQHTSAAMEAAWPHLLCVEPSRHAFSQRLHTVPLPHRLPLCQSTLCLLGALSGRPSQLSRAPQPYASSTRKACHRFPPNMWPHLHAALYAQVTACPLQPPPAFPGRAAEQEGSATVPALPHPGARACAVLARLSTGPTAAGVQRAPTRLTFPLCWALDAAAPLSPDCSARAPPGFPPHTPKTARHSLPPCTASSGASDKPVLCSNLPVPPRLCPRSQPSIPSCRPAKSLYSALIPMQGSPHPKRQLTLLRRGLAGAPSSVLKAAARPEPASHAIRGWGAICLAG